MFLRNSFKTFNALSDARASRFDITIEFKIPTANLFALISVAKAKKNWNLLGLLLVLLFGELNLILRTSLMHNLNLYLKSVEASEYEISSLLKNTHIFSSE